MTKSTLLLIVSSVTAVVATVVTTLYGFRELPPARYAVIHSFTGGKDGGGPVAGLVTDDGANLYGLTFSGTIFKISPPTSPSTLDARQSNPPAETPTWNVQGVRLDARKIGGSPDAGMVWGPAGELFGIAPSGGSSSEPGRDGTLFKLNAVSLGLSEPVPLYSMPAREFNDRYSDLISDTSGALYGTTSGRGASSMGTVFKLSPTKDGWAMSTLYTFKGGDDGAYPGGGLVLDRSGALYGTTGSGGGKYGLGTVFKLTPTETGWEEKVIHAFRQEHPFEEEGLLPMAGLTIDGAGTLYGTTGGGGQGGGGTVFSMSPSGDNWTFRVLCSFSRKNDDGRAPNSRLVFGDSGELYGTTRYGGLRRVGTVFRLAPVFRFAPTWFGWKKMTIHSFAGGADGDGSALTGGLVRNKSGTVFGTTNRGGLPRNNGTVFEIVP